MNAAHWHLLLNHLPVVGTIGAILLLAYALLRRSPELTRVSLGLFVLVALAGVVVYLTGEPAEEAVENLAGMSESVIESHEEAALLATLLLVALGAIALGGLVAFRRRATGIPRGFAALALALSLAPAAAMGYTANLGGQIRHTEIRAGAVAGDEAAGEAAARAEAGGGRVGAGRRSLIRGASARVRLAGRYPETAGSGRLRGRGSGAEEDRAAASAHVYFEEDVMTSTVAPSAFPGSCGSSTRSRTRPW